MNRRHFIALGAATLAGCRGASTAPPPPPPDLLSDEDRARIATENAARRKYLAELEPFRVGSGETRRTPPPMVDIVEMIPELKTQRRVTHRLHPRFGEEPPPGASKIGGQFLWPADAPWPVHPESKVPMVGVVQLVGEAAWPQIAFRPGCDIFQLLWCPRDPVGGELTAQAFWRRSGEMALLKVLENQTFESTFANYLPIPCRLHPEWVAELPDWETLRRTDLRAKLAEWKPPHELKLDGPTYFNRFLAGADGSKVGGWPRESLKTPSCKKCQWAMDYLLTLDASEWTPENAARWRPAQDADDALGRRSAIGLSLAGGSAVEIYICRRCDDWPIRAIVLS